MAAPIERLHVPLPVVELQARTLAGCLAEQQHLLDPADGTFAALACRSECCRTESGDPAWDAWLAQRIADHEAAWNAHHQTRRPGMSARERLEAACGQQTPAQLIRDLDDYRAEVIAERDAQIIAWLCKKADEYGISNRENRAKAEAVGRMADKLSRGAVR